MERRWATVYDASRRILQGLPLDDLTDRSLRYSVKDLYYTYDLVDLKTRQDAILFLEFARAVGIPPNIGVNVPDAPQKNVSILEEDTDPTDTDPAPEPSAPPENPYSFTIQYNNEKLYLSIAQVNLLLASIEPGPYQLYVFLQQYQRDIRENRISNFVVPVTEATFNRVKEILGLTFPSA